MFFPHSGGGWKPETQVWAGLVPSEASPLLVEAVLSLCLCVFRWPPFDKDISHMH